MGAAFNVRFAVATSESLQDPVGVYIPPPIRALRSGEVAPPAGSIEDRLRRGDEIRVALNEPLASSWAVVTRYSDELGRSWETWTPSDPEVPIGGPRQLRSRRWQFWRSSSDW